MSAPPNRAANPLGGGWSPEPELRESAPRRYAPSPYTDLNQPNAPMLLGGGGAGLLIGLILFFIAFAKGGGFLIFLGAILALGGAALIAVYPAKLKAHRDRAANLVENGVPVMGRIVKVENLTGDSQYNRVVTYMITVPGDTEESRREVKADDRSLPKAIPGPVTALVDFRTKDVELYCVLPYQAVSKSGATAPSPENQIDLPTSPTTAPTMGQTPFPTTTATPNPSGGMATISNAEPQKPATIQMDPDDQPKRPTSSGGAAKLPWET